MTKRKKVDDMARYGGEGCGGQSLTSWPSTFQLEVGCGVHHCSWGKRSSKKAKQNSSSSSSMRLLWSGDNFDVEGKIGHGHFGIVYRAIYKSHRRSTTSSSNDDHASHQTPPQYVALKRFSKEKILSKELQGGRSLELLKREVSIQSHLQHANILPLLGYYEDEKRISLVMEYAPKGDVFSFMMGYTEAHDRIDMSRRILWQICQAVRYLHSRQVAHRDIKPDNILVCRSDTFKLGDFGWACFFSSGHMNKTLCGTPEYIPPEMLRHNATYSAEYVDPWALGVLAFELVHACTPFTTTEQQLSEDDATTGGSLNPRIFDKIRAFRGVRSSPATPVADVGMDLLPCTDFADLVSRWMQVEPCNRLSAEEALSHIFFRPIRRNNRCALTEMQSPTVAQRRQLFQHIAAGRSKHRQW